ncbi:MAG: hypothetical protein ACF8R9_16195 [Phycisphaerales bacterium JB054]
MKTIHHLGGATLVALALILGSATNASAQMVCEDFTGMSSASPGTYQGSTWDLYTGGGGPFPPGYFRLTNTGTIPGTYPPPYDSADFWIISDVGGEELVYHPGTPGGLSVEPWYMGARATYFSADLVIGAGNATITAYGANDVVIFEPIEVSGSYSLEIRDVGPIYRVEIVGSDDERYFDNLCAGAV